MSEESLPRKLKLPSHVMNFRCAQCGECCTNKWRIEADAVSYKKLYEKCKELGRHKELYDNMVHAKTAPQIRFLANGKCPYLSKNNLCNIQLEIGEQYMLDICKVYPRRIFLSEQTLEFALRLTCMTAVQTLQQGPIHIIETAWPLEGSEAIPFSFLQPSSYTMYNPNECLLGDLQLPYNELEYHCIQLLQDRTYSLKQRLITLGHVLGRLTTACSNSKSVQDVAQCIQSVLSDNQHCDLEPDLERHLKHFFWVSNIFLRDSSSVSIFQKLSNLLLILASDTPHQIKPASEIIRLKINPPRPGEYQQKLEKYFQPAYSIVEPILENYMVNFLLSKHFYMKPLQFAYYRLAFLYAATVAFSTSYSTLIGQPATRETILQAIYDVENIYYPSCFYSHTSFLQTGQSHSQIIDNGIALVNV